MNVIGFAICRVARGFGLKSEMNRRMAITRETQLLTEAEVVLGSAAWRDSENIQEIAEEFYQVNDLEVEAARFKKEIHQREKVNDRLVSEQKDLESSLENQIATLTANKSSSMQQIIALMNEMENLKIGADITRKKYSGMKLRLKSLIDHRSPEEELETVRGSLTQLKHDYAVETKQIVEKQELVRKIEKESARLEDQIELTREDARARITALMNEVGKSSNLVARYGAKLGAIEKNINDLAYSVGNFLSNNTDNPTPEIKEVIRKHRGTISRIASLKSSIRFNRILTGQSD